MEFNTPKIALGTWSWGIGDFAGGDTVFGNNLDTAELTDVFQTALENNLNLFDTAFVYANGQSERILGELIQTCNRQDILISDKFSPGAENKNAKNPVTDMLNGSLQRLGTDYIDIYWIHNSAGIEYWTPLFAQAVQNGHIKRIGVSNHNLAQVKRVQEILNSYDLKLSAVQNHFSLLYRNSIDDGLLEYCHDNNIQFFAYMV